MDLSDWLQPKGPGNLSGKKDTPPTFTVPQSAIGSGVEVTVQGFDTDPADGGAGPVWSEELGAACNYVALGDSFSAGNGAPDAFGYQDPSIYDNSWLSADPDYSCNRSLNSFAGQLASDDSRIDLTLLAACTGGWTTDVDPNLTPLGGGTHPLDGEGHQLDAPQVQGADIVSVTAGGNDLGFAPVLSFCVTATNCENYFDAESLGLGHDVVDANISDIYPKLVQLYEDIATTAPKAQIYVLDYPHLFDTGYPVTCWGIQPDESAWFQAKQDELDDVIGAAAYAAAASSQGDGRIHYVDVRHAFDKTSPYSNGTDHTLCGNGQDAVRELVPKLPDSGILDFNFVQSFHPSAFGYGLEEKYLHDAIFDPPADPYQFVSIPYTKPVVSLGAYEPLLLVSSSALDALGGAAYTYTVSGFDPESSVEMSIFSDPISLGSTTADANGAVQGTISLPASVPEGTHTLVFSGTGSNGAPVTEYQTIEVSNPGSLVVATPSLPAASVGTPYPVTTLTASGGTLPLNWSIASGSLPPGMALDPATGIIDGTPSNSGSYDFTVGVTDSGQTPETATQALSITVSGTTSPLSITTTSLLDGTVGTKYPTTTLDATGGVGSDTWSVTQGSLPDGLALDYSTGAITGTPTTGGNHDFTVEVTDSEKPPETATKALSIAIGPGSTTTNLTASAPSVGTGQPEIYTATVASPLAPGGKVDFTDNGASVSSCQNVSVSTSAPYVATCTISYDSAGPHSIVASYGGDISTQSSTSQPISITVGNATGSPNTTVLLPAAGATLVGGGTWLVASATGQHSITKVQFEISGGSVSNQVIATGVPTIYGYLTAFDSSNFPNGTYTIRSVATDSQGLTGTSAPVSITIANVPLTTSVIVPTSGVTLRDRGSARCHGDRAFADQVSRV